jgi:hypothetical protein
MEKNIILIFGFPHSGTTILRKIIGKCNDIYEYKHETWKITDEMKINEKNEKNILIKWPYAAEEFMYDEEYKNYKKIFIIRNPYYVFSSLNTRLNYNLGVGHTINYYHGMIKNFLKMENRKDIYRVKYEDLFNDNYKELKNILNYLELNYDETIFEQEKEIPNIIPNCVTDHEKYREYQNMLPLENFNGKTKLNLTEKNLLDLSKIPEIKKLYN